MAEWMTVKQAAEYLQMSNDQDLRYGEKAISLLSRFASNGGLTVRKLTGG